MSDLAADVLHTLARDPGRPRLTWYGAAGERVELSGAVTVNWVVKSANLLLEEFDAGPGLAVELDLPMHWRTICWALAVWRVGACVSLPSAAPVDLVLTDRPVAGRPTVAVSLPALSRRFAGTLPPDALDAAATLGGYPDALGAVPPVDGSSAALRDGALRLDHAALRALEPAPPARVIRVASAPLTAAALLDCASVLAGGGSLVLVGPGHPAAAHGGSADAELARLAAIERASVPAT